MPSGMAMSAPSNQPSIACGPPSADISSGIVMNGPMPIMFDMFSAVAWSSPKRRSRCGAVERSVLTQRVAREGEFLYRPPADEVLLDDAFERGGRARVIPDALGIHDGDGTLGANLQAVDLGAIDERLRADQAKLIEAAFQKLPRLKARFARRALGLGLVGAQKDVAAELFDTEFRDDGGECVGFHAAARGTSLINASGLFSESRKKAIHRSCAGICATRNGTRSNFTPRVTSILCTAPMSSTR